MVKIIENSYLRGLPLRYCKDMKEHEKAEEKGTKNYAKCFALAAKEVAGEGNAPRVRMHRQKRSSIEGHTGNHCVKCGYVHPNQLAGPNGETPWAIKQGNAPRDILVARQPGSKQFGVYVNGKLEEGGFFSQAAAYDCAESIRTYFPSILQSAEDERRAQ